MQVANRHFDVVFGCFVFGLGLFVFQLVLFGLYLSFFIIGWKKTLFVYPFCSFFGLSLTATIVPILLDASPFHQLGWVE